MGAKGLLAKKYFECGYNCSQSVALAFCDELGLEKETVSMLTSGFGGGMGRLREVCGAFSGIVFVIGGFLGKDSANNPQEKKRLYANIQHLAKLFKEENGGSIICRDLLGLQGSSNPTPLKRTEHYYKTRPCSQIVEAAADILDEFLRNNLNTENN